MTRTLGLRPLRAPGPLASSCYHLLSDVTGVIQLCFVGQRVGNSGVACRRGTRVLFAHGQGASRARCALVRASTTGRHRAVVFHRENSGVLGNCCDESMNNKPKTANFATAKKTLEEIYFMTSPNQHPPHGHVQRALTKTIDLPRDPQTASYGEAGKKTAAHRRRRRALSPSSRLVPLAAVEPTRRPPPSASCAPGTLRAGTSDQAATRRRPARGAPGSVGWSRRPPRVSPLCGSPPSSSTMLSSVCWVPPGRSR